MTTETFHAFQARKLQEGHDEVLLREWAPNFSNEPHAHKAGDTFLVARGVVHSERYGPEGAVFWAARKN